MYLIWREMTYCRTLSDTPFRRMRREANIVAGIAMIMKIANDINMVISSTVASAFSSSADDPLFLKRAASIQLTMMPVRNEMQ